MLWNCGPLEFRYFMMKVNVELFILYPAGAATLPPLQPVPCNGHLRGSLVTGSLLFLHGYNIVSLSRTYIPKGEGNGLRQYII
jgi:hypothetical protein